MKVLFDTSVLVAASHDAHPFHLRARVWSEAVHKTQVDGMLTVHAIAEIWSVLTRLPAPHALSPAQATELVNRLRSVFSVRSLDQDTYARAIQRCTERRLKSGAVFDALHLIAAEDAGAQMLLTFNEDHFRRLAATDSLRIVVPPEPPLLLIV